MQVVFRNVFFDATGYGNCSRQIAFALEDAGVDVKLDIVGKTYNFLDKQTVGRLVRMEKKPLQKDRVLLTVAADLDSRDKGQFRKAITCVMWETTKVPPRMAVGCNEYDAMIVPNAFNRQAFWNAGVRIPMYISPYGVDSKLYTPRGRRERLGESDDTFVFLSVFGWSHRKGPDVLVKAFLEEFNADDPVALIIKTHGMAVDEFPIEWYDEIANSVPSKKRPRVRILTKVMAPEQMAELYRGADCFVLPTRGEGVGLPILESMASGTPVITTGWSGHLDFMGPGSGYLVPYVLGRAQPLHYTSLYQQDQLWAEPDQGSLQALMRRVVNNPREARERGEHGRQVAKRWNWNRTAQAFIAAIQDVTGCSMRRE